MINYAQIEENKVTGIYIFDSETEFAEELGTFVNVTSLPEVAINWEYDAENGTFVEGEPVEVPVILTQAEWISTFTPSEWEEAQNGSSIIGYVIDGEEVADSIRQQWRQYLDIIASNETVELASRVVSDYYDFLTANGYITEEREATLSTGRASSLTDQGET